VSTGVSSRAETLREVAEHLAPAQMLTRMGERARFTVSAVTVVGSTLTALGIISADRLGLPGPARALVLASVALAAAALLCALAYLLVRARWVNRRNLAEVQEWLTRELTWVGLVVWASRLLFAAVVLAAVATVTAILASGPVAAVTVQLTGVKQRQATVAATVSGARPGDRYTVALLPRAAASAPLMVAEMTADATGKATLTATVGGIGSATAITARVSAGRDVLISATADLAGVR
jgi:hypothetical protein